MKPKINSAGIISITIISPHPLHKLANKKQKLKTLKTTAFYKFSSSNKPDSNRDKKTRVNKKSKIWQILIF
jgi:hypothetical protein